MKPAGTILTALIVFFWVAMNGLLVRRQLSIRRQDRYRLAVSEFLGSELRRERWLGIYRKGRKIGYSGWSFEKVLAAEGFEFLTTLESAIALDVLGRDVPLEIQGSMVLDADLRPKALRLDALVAKNVRVEVAGKAEGERFRLEVRQGQVVLASLSAPREELLLGDGLAPSLPVSGLRVGDSFSVPCFDPMTMSRSQAEVKVVRSEIREVEGLLTDVFELETRYRNMESRSWVTSAGELLRQEFGPPLEDVVLRREARETARRILER
ncbi:MAG: hypothetical protein ACUVYA_09205 [Planctomycetota bacterium]